MSEKAAKSEKSGGAHATMQRPDFGLLVLRVGLGVIMVAHGVPKFLGGREVLERVGSAMGTLGMDSWHVGWGFLAAMAEVVGGVMLVLGFCTRTASFFLMSTMTVATVHLVVTGAAFGPGISHPLKMALVFAAMMFLGAGKYSLDKQG